MQRLDSFADRIERDEPIDYAKELRLITLDTVRSQARYTQEAINRTTEADASLADA